jgi:hypothetical protein
MHKIQSGKKWWTLCLVMLISIAAPLLPYLQTTASASGVQLLDNQMENVCLSENCGSLNITLNLPNGVTAAAETVSAKRVQQVDNGGKLDNFNLVHTGGNTWESGNIFLTGSNSHCDVDDAAKSRTVFNVTVTGPATGSANNLTTCRTNVTLTINTVGKGAKATTGSIAGTLKSPVIAGGDVGICPTGTSVEITNKKTNVLISNGKVLLDNKGHYDSGQIPPGVYHVAARCSYPAYQSTADVSGDVTVVAGKAANGDLKGNAITRDATVGTGISPDAATKPQKDIATCDNTAGILSWIVCPIIDIMTHSVDGIYAYVIQPLLKTNPLPLDTNQPNYKVWSSFRIIGDIFLVIALLVIVFGQSIGGGLIDAYSAKKILPRLLAAAVLINISYYLVALAVDVSNIIGGGIQSLLLTPFSSAKVGIRVGDGAAGIGLTATVASIWAGVTATGATAAAGAAAAATAAAAEASAAGGAAVVAGGSLLSGLLPAFLLFILLPALLIIVAILAVVIFREGLILLLVLTSPVAFALYCLPNTEQYFRKWWDLLVKTLLVYPIIAVLFALGNIFAITITNSSGFGGPLKPLIGIVALFVPLFLIPFAFKLAGGILGRLHEIISTGGKRGIEGVKGNPNDQNSLRNQAKFKMNDALTTRQERAYNGLKAPGNSWAKRRLGSAIGVGNIQARRARYNKAGASLMADQIATGDDTNVRDTLIAWDPTGNGGAGGWYRRMDMENGHAVAGASAVYKDKTQGQEAHNKAMSLWGGNKSYMQEAMYYEWKKTGFEGAKMERIESQYGQILAENGFSGDEGTALMKGVTFKHQGDSLSGKHSSFKQDKKTGQWGWERDGVAYANEWGRRVDTYGAGKQDEKSYKDMTTDYVDMSNAITELGNSTPMAGADHVFTEGRFKGKTRGQVEEARSIIERVATVVDPDQRQSGVQVKPPEAAGEHGDGSGPQGGGFGISSAPVEVQKAAGGLTSTVQGIMAGEGRRAVTASGRQYAEASPGAPQGGSRSSASQSGSGGSGIVKPGDKDFKIPPGSRP